MAEQIATAESVEMSKTGIIVDATSKHTATVIFLHGLGDVGDSWCFILNKTKEPYVKLICPTAPSMPVTVNRGYIMPSWYDIYALNESAKEDEEGIKAAAAKVHQLLDYEQEKTGISSNRIVLGGISQGGSLAMYAALTYCKPLAGILGLSSWIPLHNILKKKMSDANKEVPFLLCHGDVDMTVSYEWGVKTSQFVQTFNSTNFEFKTYHGLAHWCNQEELADVQAWMNKHIPNV